MADSKQHKHSTSAAVRRQLFNSHKLSHADQPTKICSYSTTSTCNNACKQPALKNLEMNSRAQTTNNERPKITLVHSRRAAPRRLCAKHKHKLMNYELQYKLGTTVHKCTLLYTRCNTSAGLPSVRRTKQKTYKHFCNSSSNQHVPVGSTLRPGDDMKAVAGSIRSSMPLIAALMVNNSRKQII